MLSTRRALTLPIAALLGLALLAVAGCDSKTAPTPENFIAALNHHFMDRADCLFPESPNFPYETSDPVKTKQMNTLVVNQLLTVQTEPAMHVSRYTPTETGARAAPRFCYGHRVVTAIESFTPPAKANGFVETHVVYRYGMEEAPVWARSADVQKAFPEMTHELSGEATGEATLAASEVDWQVPD